MRRGSVQVRPQSGTSPTFRNDTVNFAVSSATTTSARQAMLAPAPAACPRTAVTRGFGKVMTISATRAICVRRSRTAAASWLPIVFTSPPAQKWSPAPVTITARTASSSAIEVQCLAKRPRVSGESALRASGRSMVRTVIPSSRSSRRKVMVDVASAWIEVPEGCRSSRECYPRHRRRVAAGWRCRSPRECCLLPSGRPSMERSPNRTGGACSSTPRRRAVGFVPFRSCSVRGARCGSPPATTPPRNDRPRFRAFPSSPSCRR